MELYIKQNKYDKTTDAVKSARSNLNKIKISTVDMNFMMGFDGYVDLLYNMVKNRKSIDEVEIYETMAEYGQRVLDTAGSSASIERLFKKKLGGGFAPNMARAIANMAPNSQVDLYAAMGYPETLEIFKELPKNINLHSVGNPGETLAMEFEDGKIMSQDMGGIFELTWEVLSKRMGGKNSIISSFNKSNAIGNGHWSLMLTMNSFFEHFIEEILPNVKNVQDKLFFVDPADLNKRSTEDIRKMLFLLKRINDFIPVVLSLNDREAIDVAAALKEEKCPKIERKKITSYVEASNNINKIINIDYLVIHDPHFATISGNEIDTAWVTEGYTSKPKFTVAAGDHFNAAILMSLLSGLRPEESLVVANAATAIFVRTGESPSIKDLKKYIDNYFDYILNDIDFFSKEEE